MTKDVRENGWARKKPPQVSRRGLAIVYRKSGEFWSHGIFDNPTDARKFFNDFWSSPGFEKAKKPSWGEYKLVTVRQSLTYLSDHLPQGPSK